MLFMHLCRTPHLMTVQTVFSLYFHERNAQGLCDQNTLQTIRPRNVFGELNIFEAY